MGMMNNERDPIVTPIYIGTQLTSANAVVPGIYFRKHSRIKNAWLVNSLAITKSNSNHLGITLQDNAGTPVVYATVDTSDTAAVAATPLPLNYTNSDSDSNAGQAELDVPAGTMLNVLLAGVGTTVPTLATVLIEWYPL
jgi:hypothetical protein